MTTPRAMLTSVNPGLNAAITSALIRFVVSGVWGQQRTIASARKRLRRGHPAHVGVSTDIGGASGRRSGSDGNDMHAERFGEADDFLSDPSGPDDHQGLVAEFTSAIAFPVMRVLPLPQLWEEFDLVKHRTDRELGQRTGVDSAGGGDDDVHVGHPEFLHHRTNTSRGCLDPAKIRAERGQWFWFAIGEVPENVGLLEHRFPIVLLSWSAGPVARTGVVGHIASGWKEIGAKKNPGPIVIVRSDPLSVDELERRGDDNHCFAVRKGHGWRSCLNFS